jgi:hypothetical protein
MANPPPFRPLEPVGFLEALRDGTVTGWARDPADPAAVAVVRLMRGLEVLAECPATLPREDGLPGFRLQPRDPITVHDLLEGRVRIRATLPGRPAPVTLAMTGPMRAALEAEAGWGPTAVPAPPPPAAPVKAASAPPPAPKPGPVPAATPPPGVAPAPAKDAPAPAIRRLLALSDAAAAAGVPAFHLVLPDRDAVLGRDGASPFGALEAEAARHPALARDWVPLRAAFGRDPNPGVIWRADGRRLSVEGGVALLRVLLAACRLRLPGQAAAIARGGAILDRADLASRPRRDLPAEGEPAFLGVPLRETEPVMGEEIFFDLQSPVLLPGLPGLDAWNCRGAPLPWRMLLLTSPGLGRADHPAAPGWWLRHLAAECLISEALETAPPEPVLAVRPGVVVTLSAGG